MKFTLADRCDELLQLHVEGNYQDRPAMRELAETFNPAIDTPRRMDLAAGQTKLDACRLAVCVGKLVDLDHVNLLLELKNQANLAQQSGQAVVIDWVALDGLLKSLSAEVKATFAGIQQPL